MTSGSPDVFADVSRSKNKAPVRQHDDLVHLLATLNDELLNELGKSQPLYPLPKRKSRPGKRGARCPAAHNRALLDGAD